MRLLIFRYTPVSRLVTVRLAAGKTAEGLEKARQTWQTIAPGEPFEYSFVDDSFNKLFRTEQQMGRVFTVFTGLALFIACMGLFGLAAFSAEQRIKEIAIHKVMGASISGLVVLQSKDFSRLVLLAFFVTAPASWYLMSLWLQDFAYRIEMDLWIFLFAAAVSFGIAWLTVSYQSVKAARINPVQSLKAE